MEWTTENFDSLSWHDVHFHGFQILRNDDENSGTADLVFDIDFILAWMNQGATFKFTISQAIVTFYQASQLRFELDYAGVSAGMCPFSIDGIEREPLEYPTGYRSNKWTLRVNWPRGLIAFNSPRFTLRLIGEQYVQAGKQSLDPTQRLPIRF